MGFAGDVPAFGLSRLTFELALLLLDPTEPGHNRDPDGVFADGRRGSDPHATGRRIDPDMQILDRFADQFYRQPGDLDHFSIHHATE